MEGGLTLNFKQLRSSSRIVVVTMYCSSVVIVVDVIIVVVVIVVKVASPPWPFFPACLYPTSRHEAYTNMFVKKIIFQRLILKLIMHSPCISEW